MPTDRCRFRAASCAVGLGLVTLLLSGCAALRREPVPVEPAPRPSAEGSLVVTATAYLDYGDRKDAALPVGAWGDRLAPDTKAVAVSADLLALGLVRGTRVRIEGLPGEWRVLDRMPKQWTRRIDIYMGHDGKAARTWGRRKVRIHWTKPRPADASGGIPAE